MSIPLYPIFFNSPSEAEQRPTMDIYNPYSSIPKISSPRKTTESTRLSKPIVSGRVTRKRSHKPTRVAEAAIKEIVYKQKTCKAEIHPNEDYGVFDPSRRLYEDPTLEKFTNSKKTAVLVFHSDSSDGFIEERCHFMDWKRNRIHLQKDTILRNFRACYKRRVMIPVNAQKLRFAFFTEPSIHLGMTREELADFIAKNNLNGPSTPIERSIPVENSIYPSPPSSASEFINSFDPLFPSTETFSDTVPAPLHHYSETNNFFNAQFAQPPPMLDFNSTGICYQPFWNLPAPIMPKFINQYQYEYESGCKYENTNL